MFFRKSLAALMLCGMFCVANGCGGGSTDPIAPENPVTKPPAETLEGDAMSPTAPE